VTTTVRERPILFSSPMVRAILEGRKTQTRRVIGNGTAEDIYRRWADPEQSPQVVRLACRYGQPGDLLWVRETWATDDDKTFWYRADGETYNAGLPWRPSIHMPRAASRITLEIVSVRVERVQDISREDARAEGLTWVAPTWGIPGIANSWNGDPRESFKALWNDINAKRGHGWDSNPWVWVVEFKRLT
jgi:hypothetical protein